MTANIFGSICASTYIIVVVRPVFISLKMFTLMCILCADTVMALFHCMVWYGSERLGTVRLSSGRFAFPLQFSTAIELAGLFTCRYNCAASTAVTSS